MASRFIGLYPGTRSELALEPSIAAMGLVYRTNFPLYLWGVDSCFPDFIIPALGAIIEVDGPDHDQPAKKKADLERTARLNSLGYTVVRCTNDEALADPVVVTDRLLQALIARWGMYFQGFPAWADWLANQVPSWPPVRPAKPREQRPEPRQPARKAARPRKPAHRENRA